MKPLPYSQVINKGIKQLFSLQEKDGNFLGLLSSNEHDFYRATEYNTTFLTLIIFLSTTSLPATKEMVLVRKNLEKFVLSQKSKNWSWNYLQRNSKETQEANYPDDLDVTFCALASLSLYDKKLITGDIFAYVVKILTATEEKEGGPYRTWIVKKTAAKEWQDIDVAVNANIAYFLSLHDITLPNLQKYFDTKIKQHDLLSPYYPSFYATCYFLSRFYTGKYTGTLENILWKNRNTNGSWENPLKTAMSVLTLLNLGVKAQKVEKSIAYLIRTQKNGLWPANGFCINNIKNQTTYFVGSPALTTAFCLAVLQKYQEAQQEEYMDNKFIVKEETEKKYFYSQIIKNVIIGLDTSGEEISGKASILLQRVLKNDSTQQIPLIPYYFFHSLKKKNKKITKQILIQLGTANILGWIAYTIFDDFLDDEGDPLFLPIATVALRQLTYIFDTFPIKEKKVQELFHVSLNTIDNANTWELKNCRIKNGSSEHNNFLQLANKSIGHALGPLVLFLLSGYKQESKEFKLLQTFFVHYLITKQINDDAHDWQVDLKKGHLTPVLSLLLKRAEEKKVVKNNTSLKQLFWEEIIQEVCALIYAHAKKAKKTLRKLSLLIDPTMLELLLEKNVRSADKALEEQKKMTAFLQTYTS